MTYTKKDLPRGRQKKFKPDTSEYAMTIKTFLNMESYGEDPIYIDDMFILAADNEAVLDREYMKVHKFSDYQLSNEEKEIATQLIRDAYLGTFDELIITVKKLANE